MTTELSKQIEEYVPQYENLMNPERLRGSLKRLFSNNWFEVFSELLQNSQRAGAKNVDIRASENLISYADDGHGLIGGISGFETMLALAVSYFENEEVKNQDPMGLGIHALLANTFVRRVCFWSGNFSIGIDTERWWNDPDYYKNWHKLVEPTSEPLRGMEIIFQIPDAEVDRITGMFLELGPTDLGRDYTFQIPRNPARGYFDIFSVTLNGKPVNTGNAYDFNLVNPVVEFSYQGNQVKIEAKPTEMGGALLINWYGQIIRRNMRYFSVAIHVRNGRPLNPKSPVRSGLIEDEKLKAFEQAVEDELFRFLVESPKENITPDFLKSLYHFNKARFIAESPWITVQQILPSNHALFNWHEGPADGFFQRGPSQVVAKSEDIICLEKEIRFLDSDDWFEAANGLPTFLDMESRPYYSLGAGDKVSTLKHTIYWKPGPKVEVPNLKNHCFREAGVYAIGLSGLEDEEIEALEWNPVTLPVIVCSEPSNEFDMWSCVVFAPDVIDWLKSDQPIIAFALDKDEDWDPQIEDFDDTVRQVILKILGNAIAEIPTYYLQEFFMNKNSKIESIRFLSDDKEGDIEVTNAESETKKLKFYH